jgi:hypothetical protein
VHARAHAVGLDHASERVLFGSQAVNYENAPEVIVCQIPECTLFQFFVDEIGVAHETPRSKTREKKKLALARVCESGARCFCVANSQEQVRSIFIISSILSTLKILDWPSYDFS